jgi:hypothetical protein
MIEGMEGAALFLTVYNLAGNPVPAITATFSLFCISAVVSLLIASFDLPGRGKQEEAAVPIDTGR